MKQPAASLETTYRKLVESSLYQTYKKAFRDATGLNLVLRPADEKIEIATREYRFTNSFCEEINNKEGCCKSCRLAHRCLLGASARGAETISCFAGMRETAIPVHAGTGTVAFLTTGQVMTQPPDPETFDSVVSVLEKNNDCRFDVKSLKKAWLSTETTTVEKYQGSITLLAAFGLQLSELLNRILVEDSSSEPEVVTRAKKYIIENLGEKIVLEKVATHVGVSPYYFCKLFKQSTGMTLTEYVNRRRVEWAKRKLTDPRIRVTEVAYDVGYQSLSQFNRSFSKYVGMSPTRFREHQSSDQILDRDLAA